jgi:hypothetical protein
VTVPDNETPTPRDVIAAWFKGDDQPYNHADSIIGKLWKAGYRIGRSRYPMAGPDEPQATLFLALTIPGVDAASTDPDELAEDIATSVNENLAADSGRVMVNAIPAPQWLTAKTLANLRAAAALDCTDTLRPEDLVGVDKTEGQPDV